MELKEYESPQMDVIVLGEEDVIRTSGDLPDNPLDPNV